MRSSTWLLALAVASLLGCACADDPPEGFNPDTMMRSSDVRRGMAAVGKSVFHGVEITEFGMEILAVLEKSNLGKDLIVGRILDGPVVERDCGVMGGMSGSPVYVDGKLIGAVAYTYIFEKEPVCGITSIESMLVALDGRGREPAATERTPPPQASTREEQFRLAGRDITGVKIVSREKAAAGFEGEHTLLMCPVSAPLYCAGLPAPALEYLRGQFKDSGIEPIAGPGMRRQIVETELVAGSAFGGLLASGDFDISTGGTLTYRDGDLVLGFGHPFMELGKVDVPLTTSWVHDFVPCYNRTDKMMSPMKEAGHLTQDRSWAVGGRLGESAARVPGTFKITDRTRDMTRTYHLDMLRDRSLTGRIIASGALSALYATYNSGSEGTVRCRFRVKSDRGDEISREDIFYHNGGFEGPALGDMMSAISLLNDNRFRPGDITEVDFEAELDDADNTAAIEGLYTDQTVARAGEDLTVRVRLRPDAGEPVIRSFTLKMPQDLPKGRLRVAVGSGTAAMQVRARVGILPPPVFDLDDAIKVIQSIERGNQLFVAAGVLNRDLSVGGTRLPGLPTVFLDLIRNSQRTDVQRGGQEVSCTTDMPWVLYGSAHLTLATEDRLGRRGKAAPPEQAGGESAEEAAVRAPRGVPAGLWWAASAFARPGREAALGGPLPRYGRPVAEDEEGAEEGEEAKKPESAKDENGDEKADEDETEEEEEEAEEPAKDKNGGAVARTPAVWTQSSAEDFAKGQTEGIAFRSDGAACLTPRWTRMSAAGGAYVPALAAGPGGVFAGTGDDGKVFALASGSPELLLDTGQFGVASLHVAPDGAVLAGTMPGGRLFRIAEGKGTELCALPADYIWDIIDAPEGGFLVATGAPATVYHVDPGGKTEVVAQLKEAHALRLLQTGGSLYIGTARRGALYRKEADGPITSLYSTADADITDMVQAPSGGVVISTGSKGSVVLVDPGGQATVLYEDEDKSVLSLARAGERLLAGLGGNGRIIEILDRTTNALVREADEGQITALCAHGDKVYAGVSNPGELLTADYSAGGDGKLDSEPMDAKRRARWGRVDWDAVVPDGCRLGLSFRSGNTQDPDDSTWSPWSAPLADPGRDHPGAPPARFLQYRIEMQRADAAPWPMLRWLTIAYLTDNQCPTIKDVKPAEGKAIKGKFDVSWTMSDPDKDKLKVRLLVRARGEKDYKIVKSAITESKYSWDTKTLSDGAYDLRLVVDDGLSNPENPCTTTLDIANITIDNTPPEIGIITEPVRQADGGVALTGYAMDATSIISGISWQPKGEDPWQAARLDDGLYDWRYERFLIVTSPFKETVEELTIRARDAAGNVTDKTVKLPKLETPKAEG